MQAADPLVRIHNPIRVNPIILNKFSLKKTTPKPENQGSPINSISLNLSPAKASRTIILPSSKFNKFIKLIQEEKHEIRSSQKQDRKQLPERSNEEWRDQLQKSVKVVGYSGRSKQHRRLKTEHLAAERHFLDDEKWAIVKRKVESNQISVKFPQLSLVNQSLKIMETPTSSKNGTVLQYKQKSFWKQKREEKEERKRTIEFERTDRNMEISAWMNDF